MWPRSSTSSRPAVPRPRRHHRPDQVGRTSCAPVGVALSAHRDHRRRARRPVHGQAAARRGLRRLRDPREGRRRRRHLAPQPLPGLRVRRPVGALLVLVRAQARLVEALRHASPRSSPTCEHVADKYGLRPHCRFGDGVVRAHVGRRARHVDARRSTSGETVDGRRRRQRARHVQRSLPGPTSTGLDDVRRHDVPLRALELGPRPRRRAGRGDRQRGERGAVRARDREDRAARCTSSSARRTGSCRRSTRPTPRNSSQRSAPTPTPLLAFRAEIEAQHERGHDLRRPERTLAAREAAGLRRDRRGARIPRCGPSSGPPIPYGCKRPLFSNTYYPAFNRPNLELVTDADRAGHAEDAVVTADGTERAVDTIVSPPGFASDEVPLGDRRRPGATACASTTRGTTAPQAYLGITTAGFPNLFMLYGPNTNNGSILTMIESQVDHILAHLRRMRRATTPGSTCKPDAMAALQRRRADSDRGRARVAGGLPRLLPLPERPHRHAVAALDDRVRNGLRRSTSPTSTPPPNSRRCPPVAEASAGGLPLN